MSVLLQNIAAGVVFFAYDAKQHASLVVNFVLHSGLCKCLMSGQGHLKEFFISNLNQLLCFTILL